jgi:hypothetical protein
MIKHFPEIEKFFKKQSFCKSEIKELKRAIISKYDDKSIVNMAFSLIEMKLMFSKELVENVNLIKVNRAENYEPKDFIVKPTKSKIEKTKKRVEKDIHDRNTKLQKSKDKLKNDTAAFYNKRLFVICNQLQISTKSLIEELEKFGYNLKESTLLKKEHIDAIEPWLKHVCVTSNFNASTKFHFRKKENKTDKPFQTETKGAWGKLQTFGIKGKLIYTR